MTRLPRLHWVNLWHWLMVLALTLTCLALFLLATNLKLNNQTIYVGATFSNLYASELGLSARETFLAVLDDLKIRRLRLPVYWSEVEPSRDNLNFAEVDWMLNEADKRGASIILTLGQKAPRYPECFIPKWVAESERPERLLNYLKKAVQHFDRFTVIEAWQVENEPSLPFFGQCPQPDPILFKKEVALIRNLSHKTITTTSSGEFGDWLSDGSLVDALGISVYRAAHFDKLGLINYPFSPAYYSWRAHVIEAAVPRVFVSELQLEPWSDRPLNQISPEKLEQLFSVSRLEEDLRFSKQLGMSHVYLWGVEWWYWMKKQGRPALWEAARNFVSRGG